MSNFFKKLKDEKIKINWNKNPIRMDLFLSFITVETKREKDFFGSDNGWTLLVGNDGLEIGGGVISGVEYVDKLKYKRNMVNPYNNFVNPFYLFEIFNNAGKKFFLNYYAEDIKTLLKQAQDEADRAASYKNELFSFWENVGGKSLHI